MYFTSKNGIKVKFKSFWSKFLIPPKNYLDQYDYEQVAMGIDVEMEHTDNPEIALYIVFNHLDEFPDYYSRLEEMEELAKEYWGIND